MIKFEDEEDAENRICGDCKIDLECTERCAALKWIINNCIQYIEDW